MVLTILKILLLLWTAHALVLAVAIFYEDMRAAFKIHDVTGPTIWGNIKTAVGVFLIVFMIPCIWVSNWWSNWRHRK